MDAPQPTPELRQAYEADSREPCVRGARSVAWIALLVMPPFYLVDASRFPEQFAALAWLRGLSTLAPVVALLLLRTEPGRRHAKSLLVSLSTVGSACATAQMALTGGHASPYFAGLGLGMLLPALIMPWPPRWTWLNCAAIVIAYLLTAQGFGFESNRDALANNVFSYLATALIAGLATSSREGLRWREFLARHELEASEARLREEAETARALAAAGREMIGLLDTPRVLGRLCALTTEIVGCDRSHTIMHDRRRGVWRGVAEHGDTPEEWEALRGIEVTSEHAAPVLAALSRAGFLEIDMRDLEPTGAPLAGIARAGIRTALWVPLYSGSEIIGVQTASRRGRSEPFDERQRKLVSGFAQLASMALANARLHEELARQGEAERAARALAESASRAKDDFLATLSHELRTPLNVILGYLEMLDDTELSEVDRANTLGRVRQVSRQLLYMITDTLEISRLHAGQTLPQIEEVDLGELWREVRAECDELPRPAGVRLIWQQDVPAVVLATDRRILLVVLRNLVSNGLKFTEKGSVTVGVQRDQGGLTLRVRDTGIGIPPDARDRIFEMFQQVDVSDRRRFGGVGLGLYIVNRFCSQIGASVELESEVGQGSCFTIRLPRSAPSRERPARSEAADVDVEACG